MNTANARPIAIASDALVQSQRQALALTRPERRRRQLVRLIDFAITSCERVNLNAAPEGGGRGYPSAPTAPAMAAHVVEWLQDAAGEPRCSPATNQEALEELFRLQQAYLLGAPSDDDASEGEAS